LPSISFFSIKKIFAQSTVFRPEIFGRVSASIDYNRKGKDYYIIHHKFCAIQKQQKVIKTDTTENLYTDMQFTIMKYLNSRTSLPKQDLTDFKIKNVF